ncbi:MAG: zinc-dependent metalloprotease [Bacteroidota bacterium]
MFVKKYNFLLIAGLLAACTLQAQQGPDNWCGYTGKSPWLTWYQQNKGNFTTDRDGDSTWLYVPVTVHIVGNDAGAGYYSIYNCVQDIAGMNAQYTNAHIRYYLYEGEPFVFHNKTSWYEHNWDGGSDLINSNRIEGRLNAYVVGDPAGNCGYSWQDAIVLGKNCSGAGNSTWGHEAGHHLSLPHPFLGWEGFTWNYANPAPQIVNGREVEKIDGSNCDNAGDGFCDTHPDYLNYRWTCNGNGESTVVQRDPDGVEFRSDASLIMGYPLDQCASRFSPEQIEAMRANLHSEHSSYLQIFAPLDEIPDAEQVTLISPIDTQIVQFDDVTMTFKTPPYSTIFEVEVGLFDNFQPVIYAKSFYQPDVSTVSVHLEKALPKNRLLYWRTFAYNEWDVSQPHTTYQTGVFKTTNLNATNDLEKNVSAILSPNPVRSGVPAVLQLNADDSQDALITVTDMAGRNCLSKQIRISEGTQQIDIPTEALSAGIYQMTIQNEKGLFSLRLSILD